jgi:hypothetical protein
MSRLASSAAALFCAAFCAVAGAQQLGYLYYPFALPLVAETPSYVSTIFVHNPGTAAVTLTLVYQGASSSATPGTTDCQPLQVPPGNVVKTSLGALCPINPGSNFGALSTAGYIYPGVAIYSRVETPSGNGFSIEGMSNVVCCGQIAEVVGLRRQAAAPTYQSNCFIRNQEPRTGRIVVTLASGTGDLVASAITDVQPNEFVRLLEVFATLHAAPGDYENVRASFESIAPVGGGPPVNFDASCTVQNSTSFDADFRVAKGHT